MDLEARINQLLTNFYGAFSTGLQSGWESSLADDVVVIGTDQAEWLLGRERVAPVLQAQMAEMSAAGLRVEAGGRQGGGAGSTVWGGGQPPMGAAAGTAPTMRLTPRAPPG